MTFLEHINHQALTRSLLGMGIAIVSHSCTSSVQVDKILSKKQGACADPASPGANASKSSKQLCAPATSLTWAESSPQSVTTQTTTITATWTKSASSLLANQKIQFYTGSACETASGDLIDLNSATAQSQTFSGNTGSTYTFKVTSLDAKNNALDSDCSTAMEILVADTTAPTITGVTSSTANGSYKVGQSISIRVNFSESVTITGTPLLTLETGTTDAVVNYASGSGTSTLTFTYTVAAGHTSPDLDYLSTSALALNGGTIKDAAGNNATLTLASPGAANSLGANKALVIDGIVPVITFTSISPTSPASSLTPAVTISLSEATATNGLGLYSDSSCTTAIASATTGTTGSNTITTSSLTANIATTIYAKATDGAGNASTCTSLTTYTHDNTAPTITGVTSSTANGSYKTGQSLSIQVNFSESVNVTGTPQLTLETGTTDAVLNYSSGSGTSTLTFTYTVSAGHTSADLDYLSTSALALNGGTINDAVGNNATLTLDSPGAANSLGANKAIKIDTTVPVITYTSISPTSPASSLTPAVTISLSEATATNGLGLYSDSSCTASISSATTGITGSNTITTSSLTANTATTIYAKATDPAGNVSTCTSLTTYTNDSTAPTVTSVTSSNSNGTYIAGQVVSVQVTFSEIVTVTGTPQLTLETGTTDAVVNYTGGSGTTTLTFTYTVSTGHTTSDLDYQSASALALNSGTIKDAAGNNATLSLPAVGTANSLGANKNIIVDTTAPTLNISEPNGVGDSIAPGSTFTIQMTGTDDRSTTTITLYHKATASGCSSGLTGWTQIVANLPLSTTSYNWSTSGIAIGNRYICGVITDAANTPVYTVSSGPITISGNLTLGANAYVNATGELVSDTGGTTLLTATSGTGSLIDPFVFDVPGNLNMGSYTIRGNTNNTISQNSVTWQIAGSVTGTGNFDSHTTANYTSGGHVRIDANAAISVGRINTRNYFDTSGGQKGGHAYLWAKSGSVTVNQWIDTRADGGNATGSDAGNVTIRSEGPVGAQGISVLSTITGYDGTANSIITDSTIAFSGRSGGSVSLYCQGDISLAGGISTIGKSGNGGNVVIRGDFNDATMRTGNIQISGTGGIVTRSVNNNPSGGDVTIKTQSLTVNGNIITTAKTYTSSRPGNASIDALTTVRIDGYIDTRVLNFGFSANFSGFVNIIGRNISINGTDASGYSIRTYPQDGVASAGALTPVNAGNVTITGIDTSGAYFIFANRTSGNTSSIVIAGKIETGRTYSDNAAGNVALSAVEVQLGGDIIVNGANANSSIAIRYGVNTYGMNTHLVENTTRWNGSAAHAINYTMAAGTKTFTGDIPYAGNASAPTLDYTGTTGTSGAIGSGMSVAPTTLNNGNSAISGCSIKAGTTALPAGLSIDSTTCVISGIPTVAAARATYTVVATNSIGASNDALVSIAVSSIACDSGNYDGTCTVSTSRTLAAGDVLSGTGHLVIGSGITITGPALQSVALNFAGSITVHGTIHANADITAGSGLTVGASGIIDADGLGYQAVANANGAGPGGGLTSSNGNGTGGSHGGNGGTCWGTNLQIAVYGSGANPVTPGSSGGSTPSFLAGHGGGVLSISVTGTLNLNGRISARGGNGTGNSSGGSAGGAGGSLKIIATNISGSGIISATGGVGSSAGGCCGRPGGGGAGGRVYLATTNVFAGTVSVDGGAGGTGGYGGAATGGRGTYHMVTANPCDSGTLATTCTISKLVSVAADTTWSGSGSVTIASGGSLVTAPGVTMTWNVDSMTFATGSQVEANIVGSMTTLTIQTGATISASSLGFQSAINAAGNGPGAGNNSGGAGHGGSGGASSWGAGTAGVVYGSAASPTAFGSGGSGNSEQYGGAGGGLIRFTVSGTATIDGTISANGGSSPVGYVVGSDGSGGGSGGSVWISATTIAGAGSISANGGTGLGVGSYARGGGGGGGGRIAVQGSPLFTGSTSVNGGPGGAGGYGNGDAGQVGTTQLIP